MGRPFNIELENIAHTLKWAFSILPEKTLNKMILSFFPYSLYVVGSGGSLSGAYFIAKVHEKITGQFAKSATPLELFSSETNPINNAVLFLSASGNNEDILCAFDVAVKREYSSIGVVCANTNSKLVKKASKYRHVHIFDYSNPAGKDGFLAVNSLISSCILISRAYGALNINNDTAEKLIKNRLLLKKKVLEYLFQSETIISIGGGWAWPALIDLESKFTEAGLKNVLICDLRNFAHGRHNWFNLRGINSSLLVFETPSLQPIVERTLRTFPDKYPRALLKTVYDGPLGTLDLYIQIFNLINEIGKFLSIDPGRPKVPLFGRKLYHIGLNSLIRKQRRNNKKIWIYRKVNISNQSYNSYEESLKIFINSLKNKKFKGIIFDYDGTLCDSQERFKKPREEISNALNYLLSNNIIIGIATGRGKSVQNSLIHVIEKKYWENVFIGNYNGSIISRLDHKAPLKRLQISKKTDEILRILQSDKHLCKNVTFEPRHKQISVLPKQNISRKFIMDKIAELLYLENHIKILESDHSIDIIEADISKINVVNEVKKHIVGPKGTLIIGDQGQLGGNDYEMLSLPFSLSVDKVSSSPNTCWNLSPGGMKGTKATLFLTNAMHISEKSLKLNIDKLKNEVCD